MKIAVEGCCHGELDNIYQTLADAEAANGFKVDLLICCGDFQAVRNLDDLQTMACPDKYRSMNTFYKYYSGEKEAPLPTIFIGGNHEASNHLWELPYGGWVAKNIFYLGFGGVVTFGGIRIAGLSGIYNENHYRLGHFETPPFSDSSKRSAYHVREFDVFQLGQIQQPIDIFLSHDWPRNIAHHGDLQGLLRRKSFLRKEIEEGSFGSPPAEHLLNVLRPTYWFSAHMHTKFPAIVQHGGAGPCSSTRFLALDKCLPRRDFLQILDVGDRRGPLEVCADEEWIAILRSTHRFRSTRRAPIPFPQQGDTTQRFDFSPTKLELQEVRDILAKRGSSAWPTQFTPTTPPFDPASAVATGRAVPLINPQTVDLCTLFGLPNPCAVPGSVTLEQLQGGVPRPAWSGHLPPPQFPLLPPPGSIGGAPADPNEISLTDSEDEVGASGVVDPNAIAIDDDDDDDEEDGNVLRDEGGPAVVTDPNAIDVDLGDDDDDAMEPATSSHSESAKVSTPMSHSSALMEVSIDGSTFKPAAPSSSPPPKDFVLKRRNEFVDTGEELGE